MLEDRRAALELAWSKAWNELQAASSKWSRVKGTLTATVAALQDLGFSAPSPWRWRNQDGEDIDLINDDPERVLEYECYSALDLQTWLAASRHYKGKGLEFGPDLYTNNARMRLLKKEKIRRARSV